MSEQINILLVEDDTNLGFVVKDSLTKAGFRVSLAIDGEQGLQTFQEGDYDICVLDVMLPNKDGIALAQDIRASNAGVPIIFLTAKSMIEDKVKGFDAGGDDYLTKPFEMKELEMRINAILKRSSSSHQADRDQFQIGNYVFDSSNLTLTLGDEVQNLTKKEGSILKLLCLHRNELLKREQLLKAVWGKDDYFSGRSMDVFISKLRKYLKGDPEVEIANLHGVGFKLLASE